MSLGDIVPPHHLGHGGPVGLFPSQGDALRKRLAGIVRYDAGKLVIGWAGPGGWPRSVARKSGRDAISEKLRGWAELLVACARKLDSVGEDGLLKTAGWWRRGGFREGGAEGYPHPTCFALPVEGRGLSMSSMLSHRS